MDDSTYLMLELVEGGELFDLIVDQKRFTEPQGKLHAYQIISAIDYLHTNNITHRDLKPENILVVRKDPDTLIKITDFGLSKFVDETSMLKTFCGTPNYLAPEIVGSKGEGAYTKAVDLWAAGVIVFICLGGYPPFSRDYKDISLEKQILTGRKSFPAKFWKDISRNAVDFIDKLLQVIPENRMTADQALRHKWLMDEKMLEVAKKLMYPECSANGTDHPTPARGIKRRGEANTSVVMEDAMDETTEYMDITPNPKRAR